MNNSAGIITKLQFNEKRERALLAGLQLSGEDRVDVEDSLYELSQLAETAGAVVVGNVVAKRETPTANYYIGEGKAEEIKQLCIEKKIDIVIFDDDLSPAQVKNLQDLFGIKVLDRTELILDIFAIHARSKEGRLQVELAQLQYMLPRLTHAWSHLSRQWGGVGTRTRGPGEKQLEVDRRRVRERITRLSKELERVHGHRKLQRKRRERKGIPLISIIGYTNAGKTTLFNNLTSSSMPSENQLFTTLDPKIKKFIFPNKQQVLISDTVGFIRKLPHHLVESFKATLEEVYEADLLLHVVDGSSKKIEEYSEVVLKLLKELDVITKPILTVINKIDLLDNDEVLIRKLKKRIHGGIPLSAKTGEGIDALVQTMQDEMNSLRETLDLFIPSQLLGVVAKLYALGNVISIKYLQKGAKIKVELPKVSAGEFKKWIVEK